MSFPFQVSLEVETLEKPRTVCAKCVEHIPVVEGNSSSPFQTVYTTICHDDCCLDGVKVHRHVVNNCSHLDITLSQRSSQALLGFPGGRNMLQGLQMSMGLTSPHYLQPEEEGHKDFGH